MHQVIRKGAALVALGAMTGAFSAPVLAQQQTVNEADIAALRYFLSIDDQDSVRAEIQRLEKQFPGIDLSAQIEELTGAGSQVDEGPIWELINADDYPAAHAKINEARTENPGYKPSEHLMQILTDRETQAQLETAIAAGNLSQAVTVLKSNDTLTECERINNPWRVADLFIENDMPGSAMSIYDSIVASCSEPDHVIVTLQKAGHIAGETQMEMILNDARRRNPDLIDQIDPVGEEMMAWVKSRNAPEQPPVTATRSSGDPRVSRASAAADRGDWATCLSITQGASSLDMQHQRAWCALNAGRPMEAVAGFQAAAKSNRASLRRSAEYGLVLAYAKLGRSNEAEQVASRAQMNPEQRTTVQRQLLSDRAVAAYDSRRWREAVNYIDELARTSGSLDRGMSMMRGWALHNLGQKSAAIQQFRAVHNSSPGLDSRKALIEARK